LDDKTLHIPSNKTVKDLKLKALLEVTKAINNNVSISQLLDIYQNILEDQLKVGKLVLYGYDEEWTCLLKYGVGDQFNHLKFEEELLHIKEIETITYSSGSLSKSFEIVVPVYHKSIPLAYVLLGDVDEKKLEVSPAIKHLPFIQTLTNIIVVSIENKKLYRRSIQRASIQKELELAQGMQRLLFPQALPDNDRLQAHALYIPHQQVGGDYYDFIELNKDEFIFCMADVSGKGVAAALMMSNLQATLRVLLKYTHNITEIVLDFNQRIYDNAKGKKFVSLFIAKYNAAKRQLSYINAGHNPPILMMPNGAILLDKGCTLLGIVNPLPELDHETIFVPKDSLLFAYTDGLTDTQNEKGETLHESEIEILLRKNSMKNPEFINHDMMYFLDEFRGDVPFSDDIALFCSRFV